MTALGSDYTLASVFLANVYSHLNFTWRKILLLLSPIYR